MADEQSTASTAAESKTTSTKPAPAKAEKFAPPADTTGITFSSGRPLAIGDDGLITAPDDLTEHERAQLASAGFTAA